MNPKDGGLDKGVKALVDEVMHKKHINLPVLIYRAMLWAEKPILISEIRSIQYDIIYLRECPEFLKNYCLDVIGGRVKELPDEPKKLPPH